MAIQITELLRTTSVGADRATINSNFIILQDAINDFESELGFNTAQNSIDLTGGAGTGTLKAKKAVIGNTANGILQITDDANIVKTTLDVQSGLGVITTDRIVVNTDLTVPTITVGTALTITGTSTFTQANTFSGLITVNGGISHRMFDIGALSSLTANTYTVLLEDNLLKIDFDASPGELTLAQPSPALPMGHEIKIISSGSSGGTINPALIAGWSSITLDNGTYKSVLTLQWDTTLSLWIVTGAVGVTLS